MNRPLSIRCSSAIAVSLLLALPIYAEKISLVGGTVINPADGKIIENAVLVIDGNKLESIGSRKEKEVPASSRWLVGPRIVAPGRPPAITPPPSRSSVCSAIGGSDFAGTSDCQHCCTLPPNPTGGCPTTRISRPPKTRSGQAISRICAILSDVKTNWCLLLASYARQHHGGAGRGTFLPGNV